MRSIYMKPVNKSNKILSKSQLKRKVIWLKRQQGTIVTTNGSFDILHAGHIFLLQKAKEFGDVLIVGLNSDKSVKKNKGKKRPIISQNNRAILLSAIEFVDYIYIFNEKIPNKFINLVKPNIHVNSAEYGKNCIEAPVVKKNNGKLVLLNKKKELLSTTQIIKKIRTS